jgi:prepilin-type N-terminal cleavage/methylation domain-containing protein
MHASPAVSPASSPPPQRRPGFTLVELLIATVVLAVGLLALTSAGAATVKLEERGQRLSRIADLGETRLELLRAQRCTATSGGTTALGFDERWSTMLGAAQTRIVMDSIAPRSGAANPVSSYTFRTTVAC